MSTTIKKLSCLLLFTSGFCHYPLTPLQAQDRENSFYPKQDQPFGYGLFEMMHWSVMTKTPDANIENPYLAGALFHLPWSAFQPTPDQMDTKMLDDLLRVWTQKGKKIIFQIKTAPGGKEKNPFKESSTPAWVYDRGAPYVQVTKQDLGQRIPLMWNPVFLKEYEAFIRKFAEKYDGHPGIEFIIVGPGVFASTRAGYPKMMKQLQKAGYTDKLWFETNEKILDIYRNAFHKTPLALGLAPYKNRLDDEDSAYSHLALAKRAAKKGFYLFYHNLRGTSEWANSPYPAFFASLGTTTKIALGLDNPASLSPKAAEKYGDPMQIAHNAFGEATAPINTCYLELYEQDVTSATRGRKHFRKDYEEAVRWAVEQLKHNGQK